MENTQKGVPLACSAITALLLVPAIAGAAGEEADMLSAGLTLGTDYTFRGISQTQGSMAIQACAELSLSSGLYAFAWASNVDFTQAGEPSDGASREINLAIGYAHDVAEKWNLDLQLVSYMFPGLTNDESYDYGELIAQLTYDERHHLVLGYTDNIDNTGENSFYYEAGTVFEYRNDLSVGLTYGFVDLNEAYEDSYSYLKTSIGRPVRDAFVSLDYIETFGSAVDFYGEAAGGSRFVLSVSLDF